MNELLKTRMTEFFKRKLEEVNTIILQELYDMEKMDTFPDNIKDFDAFIKDFKESSDIRSKKMIKEKMNSWIDEFNDENIDLYNQQKISKEDLKMLLEKINYEHI